MVDPAMADVASATLVVDIGSGKCKAGVAGDVAPGVFPPSAVNVPDSNGHAANVAKEHLLEEVDTGLAQGKKPLCKVEFDAGVGRPEEKNKIVATPERRTGGRTNADIEACVQLALQARAKRPPPDMATTQTWRK